MESGLACGLLAKKKAVGPTVAMGLVAVQFSQLLLPLYQTARLHKIFLAGAVAF